MAAGVIAQHHVVTHLDVADLGSDRLDHTRTLMAQHHGGWHVEAVTHHDIGVTDADAGNPHAHLELARRRDLDRFHLERLAQLANHGCLGSNGAQGTTHDRFSSEMF